MNFARLMKIFTSPRDYWNEVMPEPGDIKSLLLPQMIMLAAIPAIASFVGQTLGFMRFGFSIRLIIATLIGAILSYAFSIGLWILLGVIINALAEPFGAQKDFEASMRLATGAVIPMWVGSALHVTSIGFLGILGSLAGLGYGAYMLYLGMPVVNGTPQDKAVGYIAASIGIMFVASIVFGVMAGCPVACMMTPALLRPY